MYTNEEWVRKVCDDLSWTDVKLSVNRIFGSPRKEETQFEYRDEEGNLTQITIKERERNNPWRNVALWLLDEHLCLKKLDAQDFINCYEAWYNDFPRNKLF